MAYNILNSVLEILKEKYADLRSKWLQFEIDFDYLIDLFTKFSGINF